MNEFAEDPLSMAARHVMEGEERIARHKIRIEKMTRDGHEQAAAEGQRLLETMQETLKLSREHLHFEQKRTQP